MLSKPIRILATAVLALTASAAWAGDGPFVHRGYYITFMRMPTYDLPDWKRIVDGVRADGGDTLMLWVAGGFRSRRHPITWAYNQDHENVRDDFVRDLIAYAHTKGVRILLGFTPFGYDGVNRFAVDHPELKATGPDGKPTAPFGIGCWGWNLCPSKPESQRLMLDYARELARDFYPEADGLLIESSDYAACHCADCREHFFEREFAFVKAISDDVWARKPDAEIIVYPHYFSGAEAPGLGVRGARLPFDPRWSLFFTPHSAHPEPTLIKRARGSYWSDDSPARRTPHEIQANARRARDEGMTGYVPSLEAFTFVSQKADEGQAWLKGKRQIPLGFGWLAPGDPPYDEILARVNRIAYREFSRNPDLDFNAFRATLGRERLGAADSPQAVDDLLALQSLFNAGRTWCQPAPIASPDRVRAMTSPGELPASRRAEIRADLDRLQAIASRHVEPRSDGERELLHVARWVLSLWGPAERGLLGESP
ncbi:hypothetical protein [Paludisphaera rhizosphaerae]|uniref:hypothetical protein n=1 Tax=Paludisphaera rhizosphaerae TaxID=2711216 RepID=UPI0013EB5665|nr:hypothetical protein [Paludisphaera rhizosphaerae]